MNQSMKPRPRPPAVAPALSTKAGSAAALARRQRALAELEQATATDLARERRNAFGDFLMQLHAADMDPFERRVRASIFLDQQAAGAVNPDGAVTPEDLAHYRAILDSAQQAADERVRGIAPGVWVEFLPPPPSARGS